LFTHCPLPLQLLKQGVGVEQSVPRHPGWQAQPLGVQVPLGGVQLLRHCCARTGVAVANIQTVPNANSTLCMRVTPGCRQAIPPDRMERCHARDLPSNTPGGAALKENATLLTTRSKRGF